MPRITLLEGPRPIRAPAGKVYSTNPREALSDELDDVVVKGPDLAIVFAEAAAYELAAQVAIDVPPYGLASIPDEDGLAFCCKKLRGRYPIDHWLTNGLISNPEVIGRTIAFDVWIGNWDRNVGNFVEDAPSARQDGVEDRTKVFAIDFEKAAVLRGEPDRFTIGQWTGSRCWPVGDLGRLCEGTPKPIEFVQQLAAIERDEVLGTLERVRLDMDLAEIDWFESAVDQLMSRARRLPDLTREAWDGR